MKKSILSLSVAVLSLFLICSCKDDEAAVLSTDCYINSFELGNVRRQVETVTSAGNDTTYTITYNASYYPMTIDQLDGTIVNEDSLPVNSDVSAVLVSVESSGSVVYRRASDDENSWNSYSSADSIDLTSPLIFRAYSADYSVWRDYTVQINIHQQDGEVFTWRKMMETGAWASADTGRLAVKDDCLWLFCRERGAVRLFTSLLTDGTQWTERTAAGCENADVTTLTMFNGQLYMSGMDGTLMTSADGLTWNRVAAERPVRLLTADAVHLYALSDAAVWRSADGLSWVEEGLESESAFLPGRDFSALTYVQENGLYRVLMAGNRSVTSYPDDDAAMLWSRTSIEEGGAAVWAYFNVSPDNRYACPQLEALHLLRYDDVLLALGGASLDGVSHQSLDALYVSRDNGVTWKNDGIYVLPDEVSGRYAVLSAAVDADYYLWVVAGGQIWRGRLNELGFVHR